MEQSVRTKLELIRIEGVAKMIADAVSPEELQPIVFAVTGVETKDPFTALRRLPRYQLLEIIDKIGDGIISETVDRYYEQYRYGLKPGFSLYLLSGMSAQKSNDSIYREMCDRLGAITYKEESAFKNTQCKTFAIVDDGLLEFSFTYLKKHNYIDENDQPRFVYELEEVFVWLNVVEKYMAIKNAPDNVSTLIKHSFEIVLDVNIYSIKLTKQLIRTVFGDSRQKKGTFIKIDAQDDEPEKITLADTRLAEKFQVLNSVNTYDMMSTYLEQTMDDESINTLGVNCDKGKLYLTKNVPATQFRKWSVEQIQRLMPHIINLENLSDFNMFQARNIMDDKRWNCTKSEKQYIEKIAYAVFKCIKNEHMVAYLDIDVEAIFRHTRNCWYHRLLTECCSCGEYSFLSCPFCGDANIVFDASMKMMCGRCGNKIEKPNCDVGHSVEFTGINDCVRLYPTFAIFDQIRHVLFEEFQLVLAHNFHIIENRIELIPTHDAYLASVRDIPELMKIDNISLVEEEMLSLTTQLSKLKEKCRKHGNESCNICIANNERCCLMKIFTTNTEYRPGPHHALEFADVNFPVTLNSDTCELVGVAKSKPSSSGNFLLASAPAREMLQQVLSMTRDNRVGVIAAICPARFHDQLVQELKYIGRLAKKPIVIFDDLFLCKQLKAYSTMQLERQRDR